MPHLSTESPPLAHLVSMRAGQLLVAIIGPPGAGKSTVVAALAGAGGGPVFRLRETIRARPELLSGQALVPDPLGWVGPEVVGRVLQAAFVDGRFGFGASTVLLDNFPGTAGQLELLIGVAACTGAGLALLELRADVRTIVARVAARRVCPSCGPDSHAPALSAVDDPQRCGACRAVLGRRDTDAPGLHRLRIARYAANQPEITRCAAHHGIAHLSVNADATAPDVCRAARHTLRRLIELAHH